MSDPINSRKLDHLQAFVDDPDIERGGAGFGGIRLIHRALPELDLDAVDARVTFLGKPLSFPLIISSMTGGEGDEIARINRNLAEAAEATGVAMAVGSQRVMFARPDARNSFDLRRFAPKAVLLSNLGAVQLNYGFGADQCEETVDILKADGLYLHLNPLQEAVQPEGDRNFAGLTDRIAEIAGNLSVPVLVKEVGAGLSGRDISRAYQAGVRYFDVAGRGGTSWSRIEYHRRTHDADDLGLVLQDWGLTTVEALGEAKEALENRPEQTTLIASGGVRTGVDMAKATILGADLCGIAAPFLAAARESREAVIEVIERLRREFTSAMFLMGCGDVAALKDNSALMK